MRQIQLSVAVSIAFSSIVVSSAPVVYAQEAGHDCRSEEVIELLETDGRITAGEVKYVDEKSFGSETVVTCKWVWLGVEEAYKCLVSAWARYEDMISVIPENKNKNFSQVAVYLGKIVEEGASMTYEVKNGSVDHSSLAPAVWTGTLAGPNIHNLKNQMSIVQKYMPQICGWQNLSDDQFAEAIKSTNW